MGKIDPITTGSYYHVFNCGINGTNLFVESKDFKHFLNLYPKYINPIAETYAWCLMNNHFHLLVKIKKDIVYKFSPKDKLRLGLKYEELKWETTDSKKSNLLTPKSQILVNIFHIYLTLMHVILI